MFKHLKTYQLFESLETTEWSDIKDLINVVEDEFNFEFKQFKVSGIPLPPHPQGQRHCRRAMRFRSDVGCGWQRGCP